MKKCNTPSKVKYSNPQKAKEGAKTLARKNLQRMQAVTNLYLYMCQCGSYHLTSQKQGEHCFLAYSAPSLDFQLWAQTNHRVKHKGKHAE